MKHTEEQIEIINSKANNMIVDAKSGTGKTTTLMEYARKNKNKKILYLVFNKNMKQELDKKNREKKINNMEVKTIHSFVMKHFKNRLQVENINVYNISKNLKMNKGDVKKYINLFNLYLSSKEIRVEDFLIKNVDIIQNTLKNEEKIKAEKILENCKDFISQLFVEMEQEKTNRCFDWFIKRFQMHKGKREIKYDILLVDEAQDISPVMFDIMMNQIETEKKIFIGDSHQQIYSWRGAINILDKLKGFKKYELTNSFRLSEEVALKVKTIFEKEKGNFKIQGLNKDNKIVPRLDINKKFTYISRTNCSLVVFALNNLDKNFFLPRNINFDVIKAVYSLFANEDNLNNKEIKDYKRYKDLLIDYEEGLIFNNEVILSLLLVEEYEFNILSVIDDLRRRATTEELSDIILTTSHGAKGLEYERVLVANDFLEEEEVAAKIIKIRKKIDRLTQERKRGFTLKVKSLKKKIEDIEKSRKEELNIKYVAYTRSYGEVEFEEKKDFEIKAIKKLSITMEDFY